MIGGRGEKLRQIEKGKYKYSLLAGTITRWIGQRPKWDPVKEEFIDNDAANKFINRPRRKGFELPETV